MRFSFGPGDLLDMKRIQSSDDSSSECLFEAKLQIKFSTGSLQVEFMLCTKYACAVLIDKTYGMSSFIYFIIIFLWVSFLSILTP